MSEDPGIFDIPFHVFYQGKMVEGFARGASFPTNKRFAVTVLGNSFEIKAEPDNITWTWHSNAADNPASVLTAEIGLAIEQFFAQKQSNPLK